MAFRFKDKERPRGYTSKVAGLLHVGPPFICKGCFQGDTVQLIVSEPASMPHNAHSLINFKAVIFILNC